VKWFEKILSVQDKLGKEHPLIATAYNNIGMSYLNQDEYSIALEYFEKALTIREKLLGKEHPSVATTYNNIGAVYNNQGDYQKALDYYQKALTIATKSLGEEHPKTAMIYDEIVQVSEFLKNGRQI
jgi:tetratricopeptide (TPR) repeat protein